jgi:hypothetical protein
VDARTRCGHDAAFDGTVIQLVMAGLVPTIHVFVQSIEKTWMPATSAGMTLESGCPTFHVFKPHPSGARRLNGDSLV